jgi:two-component system chemotaxis sensor kinase CheA
MTIDMSQFYQIFFDETDEHLAAMESLLVAMDVSAPDSEDLNAIFRAAHSIKGSSGTFGFDDMMAVTHVMETLLDRVRKGEAALTTDMVDACLAAGDVLRNLLGAHKGEDTADTEAAKDVCERLEALCAAIDAGEDAVASVEQAAAAAPAAASSMPTLHVSFMPDGMVASQGDMLDNMVEELRRIGTVDTVDRPPANAPHGLWTIRLRTHVPVEVLRETIDFLAEPGSVIIRAVEPGEREPAAQGDDDAFGFFDDAPAVETQAHSTAAEDDGFGFFEPLGEDKTSADHSSGGDDSFGLFEPTPEAAAGGEVADDGSFGLFEAVTPTPAEPVVERAVVARPVAAGAPATDVAEKGAKGKAPVHVDSSIRVSVEKVDQMINLVGELVITQAMLQQSASDLDPVVFERMMAGLSQLERNTRDLQESVMSIRMMPISTVFTRFPRVVRDLSKKLNKKVELKTSGEGTELDKGLIERIADPLTHLIRNSLDHGIETPEARRAAGKPETGTITLRASHQGGNIVIEVGDDGAGLNRERILSKARERGLPASESLTDNEVWQLIFEPGFSTAAQVTEVSGRGVGMDVVKKNIAALGGRVEIDSMTGIGTRMTVRLPLTLAILDGMSVRVGSETYIIPLSYVVESLQATKAMVRSVSGVDRLIQVRGEYLSVVPLYESFGVEGAQTDWTQGIMVVLEADGAKAALFVDELVGQHQVVIKSLEANFRRVPGLSGATIMGDGRVAMILDAPGLVDGAKRRMAIAA